MPPKGYKIKDTSKYKGKYQPNQGFQKGHKFGVGKHWKVKNTSNISKALIGNINGFQKGHKNELRSKESYIRSGEKMSNTLKEKWRTPEFYRKMFNAFAIKPTKPEIFLTNFLNTLFLNEYKYVGDGQFILGGRCPDFLNINRKKKLIELFGNYWHSKLRTNETKTEHAQKRIKHFKKFGYDTLIVWESELKNLNELKKKLLHYY